MPQLRYDGVKVARPLKEINWKEVERRAEIGNTARQICQAFGIDTDTFYRRFKEEYGCSFGDFTAPALEASKANILYTQYIKALAGNTRMLELLGREICGQGKLKDDETEIEKLGKTFDSKMDQMLDLLSPSNNSDLKIEDNNISNETKS